MISLHPKTTLAAMTAFTLFLLLFAAPLSTRADTEQPRVKLGPWAGELKVGPGMNAMGKHLRGSEFVGQHIRGAVFDGCDLSGVHFWQCSLPNASFKGAHLTGAIIDECKFEGADFTDAVINGVVLTWPSHFPLSEHQLISTRSYKTKDLSDCAIYGRAGTKPRFDFRNANLRRAVIECGDYTESDFTGADISQMKFMRCTVAFSQLAATKTFQERWLQGIEFSMVGVKDKADFSGRNLAGSQFLMFLPDADFSGATIARCVLGGRAITKDRLRSTKSYHEGDLSGITFLGIDLSGCDLSRQNLTGCSFRRCDFTGALFDDAVITGAQFADLTTLHPHNTALTLAQIKSTWNYKHGRMAGIVLPKEIADALRGK